MNDSCITNVDSDFATLLEDPRWGKVESMIEERIQALLLRLAKAPLSEIAGLQGRIAELRHLTREVNTKGGKKI